MTQKKDIIVKGSSILEEKSKSWLACAIDTEGGIYLYHRKKKNGAYDGWSNHIEITNTNIEFLEHAKILMGGQIGNQTHKKDTKRKPCFKLRLCAQEKIQNILEQIVPFLIIKKSKAEIMLNFLRSHHDVRRRNYE